MRSDNFGLRDACGRPEARHRRSDPSMQNDPKRAEVDDRENYYPRLALIAGLIGIIAVVWLVNSSRASEPTAATPAAPAVTERYGNPDVWDRIENGTDCPTLYADWDQAM